METWRDGEKPLALTHLALSGLAKLAQPKEDARRLFLVDAMMEGGVTPSEIVEGLGLGPAFPPEALEKHNPDQPRVPAGNTDGGQWTSGNSSGATAGSTTKQPPGIQVAHASDRRGHEVRTDATSAGNNLPIVDAAYQGEYHDFLRDQYADILRAAGNTVVKEVPLTIASDPPITAEIDILFRTVDGVVYGIEVKTGNDPSFTLPQQIVYPHVEAGGIVVSSDPRITALGLTPGIQLNSIHLVVMRTAGPGASIDFFPILRYMSK